MPGQKILLLLILLLLSVLPVLGISKIHGSSEARETHIVSIIKNTGEWILPDRNGFVPSKPLLHHWLGAIFSKTNNLSIEFNSRLPSALSGILIILNLFLFSTRAFRNYFRDSQQLAFYCAASLVSTYGFFSMLFNSMVDMTFALWTVLAIMSLLLPIFENYSVNSEVKPNKRSFTLFYIFCGFATLAKGPLGLILPGLFVAVFFFKIFGFKITFLEFARPNIGWLLFLVLALPWYLLANSVGGDAFVERQLFFENISRFFGGENINREPFWFYIPSFLSRAAPWSFVFLFLCFCFYKSSNQQACNKNNTLATALNLSLVASICFFSIASGKRHSYLLPLYPFFVFSGVWMYVSCIAQSSKVDLNTKKILGNIANSFIIFFIVVASGVALIGVFGENYLANSPELAITFAWVKVNFTNIFLAPVFSLFVYLLAKRTGYQIQLAKLFIFTAFAASMLSVISGLKAEFKNFPNIAEEINTIAGDRQILAVRDRFDELLDPVFLYLGKPVKIVVIADVQSNCAKNKVFITRRLNIQDSNLGSGIREEAILRAKVGKPKSLEEKAISVFSCG